MRKTRAGQQRSLTNEGRRRKEIEPRKIMHRQFLGTAKYRRFWVGLLKMEYLGSEEAEVWSDLVDYVIGWLR